MYQSLKKFPWLDCEISRARWIYIFGLCYLLVGYLATNELAAQNPWGRPALQIKTVVDPMIPFTPSMIIFYILYYPILATPLFLASDAASITRLVLAQITTQSVAYMIFMLYPTPIERPSIVHADNGFHSILDLLFRADHPFNTFPSMHVAQSCIVALYFLKYAGALPTIGGSRVTKYFSALDENRIAFAILIFHGLAAVMISASAVMIKQHYVADAAGGAVLAGITSWVFFRRR